MSTLFDISARKLAALKAIEELNDEFEVLSAAKKLPNDAGNALSSIVRRLEEMGWVAEAGPSHAENEHREPERPEWG